MEPRNPLFDSDVDGNTAAWMEDQRRDEDNAEDADERSQHVLENL